MINIDKDWHILQEAGSNFLKHTKCASEPRFGGNCGSCSWVMWTFRSREPRCYSCGTHLPKAIFDKMKFILQ